MTPSPSTTRIDADFAMTIDGNRCATADSAPVVNPADRSILARVLIARPEGQERAVAAARDAFPAWASLLRSIRVTRSSSNPARLSRCVTSNWLSYCRTCFRRGC